VNLPEPVVALLPTFAGIAWDPGIRGILSVLVGVVVLCGSVYLLLGTNVGARLGLLVALAGLAGWMVIMTLTWWLSPPAIGPRGTNNSWEAVEIYVSDAGSQPVTAELETLPPPQDIPTAEQILAENPDVAADFPSGATLSDLAASHPEVLELYVTEDGLGGWEVVAASAAGEAQAVADEVLVEEGLFAAPTDYKKLEVYEIGGKPDRLDECPEAEGGSFLPDDPLCRAWYAIRDAVQVSHPTHVAVVQVQQVIPREPRPGEAPPVPEVDPTAPVISVVMVRDLGNVRFIPFLYFVIALSLFVFFALVLHYRDKTLRENLAEAESADRGA
jgi:hypothetical protein